MGIEAYRIFKLKNESEGRCMEIGEYIRINDGEIGKLIRIEKDDIDISLKWYVYNDGKNEKYVNKPYIVNYSNNIKDLIQLGDIVEWKFKDSSFVAINEVIQRPETGNALGVYAEEYDYLVPLEDIEILKILTKEQFEEYCSKVGKKDV